jgi:hypothetical protein
MTQKQTKKELTEEEFIEQWIKENPKKAKYIDTEE